MDKRDIEELFNGVYEETYPVISRWVMARLDCYHDACDVLAETYSEFYIVLNKRGADYVKDSTALLLRIAKTRLGRKYTLRKRLAALLPLHARRGEDEEESFILDFERSETGKGIEDGVLDEMLVAAIFDELSRGDPETRRIFELRYKEDLSLAETARLMGLPLHSVRNKLYRKLSELKKFFG